MKKTQEKFIKQCNIKHNHKYDYLLVNYINNGTKVKIICPIHGEFEQTPKNHLKGQGCPMCVGKNYNTKTFIKESKKIHNNKYDYKKTIFINKRKKVKIICPIHGEFEQISYLHLKNHGCPKCAGCKKSNTNEFIKKSNKIHNHKYNYSLVDYINAKTKVKIICSIHGEFEQTPNKHLLNRGCPKCVKSKSEIFINKFLIKKNIKFEEQKTFKKCKYKKQLKYDFYLPKYNTCIEYDGEQHFKKYRFEKNDDKLNIRKKRDEIKNQYCVKNNINLFRISYNDNIKIKIKEIYEKIMEF